MAFHLGLDLGGTNIKWALLEQERVVDAGRADTPAEAPPQEVVERLARLGREAAGGRELASVGVGIAGVLDLERGRTIRLPNFDADWNGQEVAAPLERALRAPVALINDARAFAVAESRAGAGRGAATALYVTVGTGVGGGLVVGGRLHLGGGGRAGEIGHVTVVPDGPACACGNRGCVEAVANAEAIASAAGRATAREAFAAAEAGDERAREAIAKAGRYLGIAIANAIVLLSPERVVVGGGVARGGGLLFDPIRAEVRARVRIFSPADIPIVPAELGVEAGAVGAALWGAERA